MRVHVVGVRSKTKIAEIKDALEFFASKLMTHRLSKTLSIRVEFLKDLEGGYAATCEPADDRNRPKKFNIHIKRTMSRRRMLTTLAHEMVHAKQWAKGELEAYTRKEGKVRWKERYYADDAETDLKGMANEYWDSPWEIDAYGREEGLYKRYIKHLRLCTGS